MLLLRYGAVLFLFARCAHAEAQASFRMIYDGGINFGVLHPAGTIQLCDRACPAGFGCVIDAVSNATACGACRPHESSAEGSTSCQSCVYGDPMSCTFVDVLNVFSSASIDSYASVLSSRSSRMRAD